MSGMQRSPHKYNFENGFDDAISSSFIEDGEMTKCIMPLPFMPAPFMPAIPMDPPSPGPEYPMPAIDFIPEPIPEAPPFKRRHPEDIDPGFTFPPHRPKGPLPMPDWRGPGGSSNPEDFMGGEGFDNPEHGFGDTIGGSFAGFGRMTRACNIPNEIQPTTPPEGLFGPDHFISIWNDPGYEPPINPTLPATPPIPDWVKDIIKTPSFLESTETPGKPPSISLSALGLDSSKIIWHKDNTFGGRPIPEPMGSSFGGGIRRVTDNIGRAARGAIDRAKRWAGNVWDKVRKTIGWFGRKIKEWGGKFWDWINFCFYWVSEIIIKNINRIKRFAKKLKKTATNLYNKPKNI